MKRLISRLLATSLTLTLIISVTALSGISASADNSTGAGITFNEAAKFRVVYRGGAGYTGIVYAEETYEKGMYVVTQRRLDMEESRFSGWEYSGPPTKSAIGETITNGVVIAANARFIMPDGDVTLTAVWIRIYRVVFHRNDDSVDATSHAAVIVPVGGSIGAGQMPSAPARPDYIFTGWNLDRNGGADNSAAIAVMQIYRDLIVYAQWEEEEIEPEHAETEESEPPEPEGTSAQEEDSSRPGRDPSRPGDETPPPGQETSSPGTTQTRNPRVRPTPGTYPARGDDAGQIQETGTDPLSDPGGENSSPYHRSVQGTDGENQPDLPEENLLIAEPISSRGELEDTFSNEDIPRIGFLNRSIPIFPGQGTPAWALLNLILGSLGVMYMIAAAFRALARRMRARKEERENYYPNKIVLMYNPAEERHDRQVKHAWLMAAILLGIVGAVLFLLMEDTKLQMVLIDLWTLTHAAIFAAEIIAVTITFRKKKSENEEDDEAFYTV